MRRKTGLAIGCALVAGALGLPVARADEAIEFRIRASSADDAVMRFGARSGSSVSASGEILQGVRTNKVMGVMTPLIALEKMFEGTAVTVVQTGPKVFALRASPEDISKSIYESVVKAGHEPTGASEALQSESIAIFDSRVSTDMSASSRSAVMSRFDIEASGASTLSAALNAMLPSSRLPRDTSQFNGGSGLDTGWVAGLNFRGTGPRSTLVQINGFLLPPVASEAGGVDLSVIPLEAVDHVELLMDGGSVTHGSDAMGGVLNVVTKTGRSGAKSAIERQSRLSGDFQSGVLSHADGFVEEEGSGVFVVQIQRREALSSRQAMDRHMVQEGDQLGAPHRVDVLGEREGVTMFGAVSAAITEHISASMNMLIANAKIEGTPESVNLCLVVPPTNANFPVGASDSQPLLVQYDFEDVLGPARDARSSSTILVATELAAQLDSDWRARVRTEVALNKEHATRTGQVNPIALIQALADPNPATAFDPFSGETSQWTLDRIRALEGYETDSRLTSLALETEGVLQGFFDHPMKLKAGVERRVQTLSWAVPHIKVSDERLGFRGRESYAAFSELKIPLQDLEILLGTRYETFSDVDAHVTPVVGLGWKMSSKFSLHGGFRTFYSPPWLADRSVGSNVVDLVSLSVDRLPTGTAAYRYRSCTRSTGRQRRDEA